MADGLNCVMAIGNLGDNAELKFGASGTGVLSWRMACTTGYYDQKAEERKERTEWISVVVFGKRAEALASMLTKGKTVFVQGELKTDSYEKNGEKRYKTQVLADKVVLMSGGRSAEDGGPSRSSGSSGGGGYGGSTRQQKPAAPPADDFGYDNDKNGDIPFSSSNPSRRERWGL